VVNGQKVWTSSGHVADLGMLIARTDSEVPKHQGITYFAIDMHQPGVDVRPLRELTGRALFNEVFLSDARVPADAMIGGLNNGWAVANTTLAHERAGLGSGGGSSSASAAIPGTVGGQLETRAGDYVRAPGAPAAGGGAAFRDTSKMMISLAQGAGVAKEPTIRQDLVRLYTFSQLGRMNNLRVKAAKEKGQEIAGMGNIAKLSMSEMVRLQRDLGLRIVGASGTLHAYDSASRKVLDEATGNPFLGFVTEMALFAQAPPIYGGTDQIQKNIIGERVLGLPKEPNQDKVVPFADLPKNA
jgi:alkylation response protein AidB-like acyl-CoA dehydrogenase